MRVSRIKLVSNLVFRQLIRKLRKGTDAWSLPDNFDWKNRKS